MVTLHKYTFLRTYLTKPLIITIPKRGMKIAKHILKTQLMPKSHSALGSTRGMAAMHGGRLNKQGSPLKTSKGTKPESDLTGKHKVAFVGRCDKAGCKDQNCATETELSTGNLKPNPCREPAQYHQQAPASHSTISYELVGNTTSTIPSNKKGITIDSQVQMNGAQKPQKLVTENSTVKVSATAIKEDPKSTTYLQTDDHTKAILKSIPGDSTIK